MKTGIRQILQMGSGISALATGAFGGRSSVDAGTVRKNKDGKRKAVRSGGTYNPNKRAHYVKGNLQVINHRP